MRRALDGCDMVLVDESHNEIDVTSILRPPLVVLPIRRPCSDRRKAPSGLQRRPSIFDRASTT